MRVSPAKTAADRSGAAAKSTGNGEFRRFYYLLPEAARAQSRHADRLFMSDPNHPSLRFKKLNGPGNYWSVRFGGGYRAVCRRDGESGVWSWVGTRQDFGKMF